MTLPACALHQLFVRSCDLAHHGLYCSHVLAHTHHSSLQHLSFRCLPSLFFRAHMGEHQNMRLPRGTTGRNHFYYTDILHSTPHSLQQLHLVRAHRLLCRYRPPHGSHMVQRLQALCPAHRLHIVPSVHKFRRAPIALSQVTFCQPRSLRLPCNSPLPHSWSVASLQVLHRRTRCPSPPTSGCRHADYTTHRCLTGRLYPTSARGVLSDATTRTIVRVSRFHLRRMTSSARRVPDPSVRCCWTRLCRLLRTVLHLTMPPHNYRSRSSSAGASSPMTL